MLTGLNHLTLAVADLPASIAFYRDLLGFRLEARWDQGAYLELGSLWLCLSREPQYGGPAADYTHYAFGIAAADFARFAAQLRAHGVREWKQNRSEGDSFYFLDPDGHRLRPTPATCAAGSRRAGKRPMRECVSPTRPWPCRKLRTPRPGRRGASAGAGGCAPARRRVHAGRPTGPSPGSAA